MESYLGSLASLYILPVMCQFLSKTTWMGWFCFNYVSVPSIFNIRAFMCRTQLYAFKNNLKVFPCGYNNYWNSQFIEGQIFGKLLCLVVVKDVWKFGHGYWFSVQLIDSCSFTLHHTFSFLVTDILLLVIQFDMS